MLKKILIGVVVVIVLLVVIVMVQPNEYHVERSAKIDAPAEIIWAEVADLSQWDNWGHWHTSDPEQKTTVTGEPGTVGHQSAWDGEITGTGKMTITESNPPNDLAMELEFFTPMAGVANTGFVIAEDDGGSIVTFSMDGKNDFVGKFFSLIMDMDEMIGGAYEDSLGNLKEIAEEKAKKAAELAAAEPEEGEAAPPAETE